MTPGIRVETVALVRARTVPTTSMVAGIAVTLTVSITAPFTLATGTTAVKPEWSIRTYPVRVVGDDVLVMA